MEAGFDVVVAQCVGVLAESFGRAASKPMIDGYRIGLSGLTPDEVKIATATALKKCKFMPAASELRELAGEIKVEDRAERAWLAFDAALSQHSVYRTISFDDAIINATVRSLGGISFIIEMDDEQYQFLRARFLKCYIALARSGVNGEATAPLLGHFDMVNVPAGHEPQKLTHIKTNMPALPGCAAIEQSQPQKPSGLLKIKKA